jgi:hypothetical protein
MIPPARVPPRRQPMRLRLGAVDDRRRDAFAIEARRS